MTMKNVTKRNKDEASVHVVTPVVNIREKEHEIILEAEMAGMEQDHISIEVHGDELHISGKSVTDVPKGYTVLHLERIPIEYKRVFTLGSDIKRDDIAAHYENGILSLTLKKSEEAQPRKIKIS